MTAKVQASRVIPANEAEVWETLTSREGMKAYMMGADVEADWRVGGRIAMRGEFNGKPYEDHGEVRSFEPRSHLSYTHVSSAAPDQVHIVTIELRPREAGTEVTVTQAPGQGVDEAADARNRSRYEKTWAAMLEDLEKAVEG
jgi:uncharacterized protein YndB with AHSA1/START domain